MGKQQEKILFVQWCAKDCLDGTMHMDAMTELVYRRIIDMIYATNDNLLDNDTLKYSTKAGSKWKKIREQLINQYQKITVEDGYIRIKKCTKKLQEAEAIREQKKKAAAASVKSRKKKAKSLKNNETGATGVITGAETAVTTGVDTGVITDVQTGVSTNREPLKKENTKRKKDDETNGVESPSQSEPSAKGGRSKTPDDELWYAGQVIRLNKSDYQKFLSMFGGTDDQFMDYLDGRDRWLSEQPPNRTRNWFISTRNDLSKNNAP